MAGDASHPPLTSAAPEGEGPASATGPAPTSGQQAVSAAQAKIDALFPGSSTKQAATYAKKRAKKTRTSASQSKRDAILELVQAGSTITDALLELGISTKSHEYYRRTDPQYKAAISIARRQNSRSKGAGWEGDSASFAETFFHHEFPTPAFHYDLKHILKSAQPGTITLINVFPNSGKTAVIEDHINETLAKDPNHRFVIASKGQNHARKLLSTVKDRMTNVAAYPEYIGRFGPFYVEGQERAGKPWTTDYIKLAQNDSGERDYNVQVMGWAGQILGSRVDTIILDDIQTGDNMSQVDEMLRKFRQDFYTRLKGGRIIIIGNRIANGDIYERLMELDVIESANHFDYPAIDHNGNSLWPDRWTLEEFTQIRKVAGESVWWTTYQQKPQLASNATFTEELVEASKDWERKVGSYVQGTPTVLAVDPGLDPGVTAITALQYTSDSISVIDGERHSDFVQGEQILDLIESYAIRYAPQHVVIETVAFQRALARDERLQSMSRAYGFQVHAHNTGRNKIDTIMGVAAMATSFIREEITFPWEGGDTSISAQRMEPILAELRAWRPNVPTKLLTQDFVMSLWFAWMFILNARHGMGIKANGWQRQGLPWTPTSTTRILPFPQRWAS